MAKIYLFDTAQPVEVVRVLDNKLEDCVVEKMQIRLIEGVEHAYAYSRLRKIRFRDDGRRYLMIHLESDFEYRPGLIVRKVLEDGKCHINWR